MDARYPALGVVYERTLALVSAHPVGGGRAAVVPFEFEQPPLGIGLTAGTVIERPGRGPAVIACRSVVFVGERAIPRAAFGECALAVLSVKDTTQFRGILYRHDFSDQPRELALEPGTGICTPDGVRRTLVHRSLMLIGSRHLWGYRTYAR